MDDLILIRAPPVNLGIGPAPRIYSKAKVSLLCMFTRIEANIWILAKYSLLKQTGKKIFEDIPRMRPMR